MLFIFQTAGDVVENSPDEHLLGNHAARSLDDLFVSSHVVRQVYRKPPNISPGLIFVHKHFLVGLYMRGLMYGGLTYGQDFVLVILTIY